MNATCPPARHGYPMSRNASFRTGQCYAGEWTCTFRASASCDVPNMKVNRLMEGISANPWGLGITANQMPQLDQSRLPQRSKKLVSQNETQKRKTARIGCSAPCASEEFFFCCTSMPPCYASAIGSRCEGSFSLGAGCDVKRCAAGEMAFAEKRGRTFGALTHVSKSTTKCHGPAPSPWAGAQVGNRFSRQGIHTLTGLRETKKKCSRLGLSVPSQQAYSMQMPTRPRDGTVVSPTRRTKSGKIRVLTATVEVFPRGELDQGSVHPKYLQVFMYHSPRSEQRLNLYVSHTVL
ncbi:hypothetical protein MAPG_09780 [Magnaporthiopsis poae ATCC 64411]|uniref:Uncharacterized protein n=1 Tax=Magnaporthiopsis poae (strain ATCC 64411 / 73-15) TaxID=644358 RepID=A0A0C4EAU9_MAGP6|nr:hypothetical protein MAPG_09780 [Magnaporthiopsis poae ATCC 64411]